MFSHYQHMDINMLLSIVNMKLRNEQQPLADFCIRYQIDQAILLQRFAEHHFAYDAQQNQIKVSA